MLRDQLGKYLGNTWRNIWGILREYFLGTVSHIALSSIQGILGEQLGGILRVQLGEHLGNTWRILGEYLGNTYLVL